eukprot:1334562-Amorphochlora_amoeboformis.AAC.2
MLDQKQLEQHITHICTHIYTLQVDVLDQSNWRPAEIVDKKEEKSYLVHYIGFDSKYDEWHTVGSG